MSQQLLQCGPDVPTWSPAPSTLDGMEQAGPYRDSKPPANEPMEEVGIHSRESNGTRKLRSLIPSFPAGVTAQARPRPGYAMAYALPMLVPGHVLHIGCKTHSTT